MKEACINLTNLGKWCHYGFQKLIFKMLHIWGSVFIYGFQKLIFQMLHIWGSVFNICPSNMGQCFSYLSVYPEFHVRMLYVMFGDV